MIRAFIIAIALSALSLCIHPAGAQQQAPQQPSASAQFVGQVSTLLATTLQERDAMQQQLAACQAAAKPPATPPAPTPETKP